jgi:hypothetical protein
MWLAQFVCTPQFFKTPNEFCGHTVLADSDDTADSKEGGDGGSTNGASVNTNTYMW